MGLSVEQQAIVAHPDDRHSNVIAVAGSGKSHTMVERVAWLVEGKRNGPGHIRIVMFNRDAMLEFKERMHRRLGAENSPQSQTFHQLGGDCLKWLVKDGHAEAWPFEPDPVKAQYFCADVIAPLCKKHGYKYPRLVADAFLGFIDRVKSDLETPEQVWLKGDWDGHYQWFVHMYPIYEQARAKRKIRFFSDLIYDPLTIILASKKAEACVANRFKHLIVDEFQDICESQYRLVKKVAGTKARVMIVGDDDQTIYTWRGAKPHYIREGFEQDFPGCITYKLTRTWRYGHILSCAANYVITHNVNRSPKLCISSASTFDTQIKLEWEDPYGKELIRSIDEWVQGGRKLDEIAILVRTYSRSYGSQFALLERGIPFRLGGGDNVSVLDNVWIAGLLFWMEVAAGRFGKLAYAGEPDGGSIFKMRRILGTPPLGITYESSVDLAKRVLAEPDSLAPFNAFVSEKLTSKDGVLADRVYKRGKLWREVRSRAFTKAAQSPLELARLLIERLEIPEAIRKTSKNADDADEQLLLIEAFLRYITARGFQDLSVFLDHIDDLRSFSDRAKRSTVAILLTSVHRSKGLEWPLVIMIGLHEGGFPHKPRKQSAGISEETRIEDERRLFYVGMTRARELLLLFSPPDAQLHTWMRAGRTGSPQGLPNDGSAASRFLYETNLMLARTIPAMIRSPIFIKAANPEVYNDYLQELGAPGRATSIKDIA